MLLSLFSAVLLALALPNELWLFGNPVLAPLALVPLFLSMRGVRRYAVAARLGLLFGGVSTLIINYWLVNFGDFSVWTLGGVTLGFVGFTALLGCFLLWASRIPKPYAPIAMALVWVAYEYLIANGYLGYPWAMVAYPLGTVLPIVQIVDVLGIWGVGFLVAYSNAALAQATAAGIRSAARHLAAAGAILVLFLGYGVARLQWQIPLEQHVPMVLVQQNADSWIRGNEVQTLERTQSLTRRAINNAPQEPDLVVWSETSLRWPYIGWEEWYAQRPAGDDFLSFLEDLPGPLLTGAPYQIPDSPDAMNATLLIEPGGDVQNHYGKQHPVPFAENVPFWEVPAVQEFFREVIGLPAVWIKGTSPTLFTLYPDSDEPIQFATPICFEDAFAYLLRDFTVRGADLFVNLTNNAWSNTRTAQTQHFVAARFRAIENRRTLVRSTNGGFSAVVDPWGRILFELPMFQATAGFVEVPVYKPGELTPYTRYGDLLPQLSLLLIGVLVVLDFARGRRADINRGSEGSA